MRSLIAFFVLLGFMASGVLAQTQGTEPASQTGGSTQTAATKAEVDQLRSEVAAQRQTIEELKAMVEKLAGVKAAAVNNASPQIRPVADAPSAGRQFAASFQQHGQRSFDERGSAGSGS